MPQCFQSYQKATDPASLVLCMLTANKTFRLESDISNTAAGVDLFQFSTRSLGTYWVSFKEITTSSSKLGNQGFRTGLVCNIHGFTQ